MVALKINSGIDLNGDGILDDNEITSTSYSCNGEDGIAGLNGPDGPDGTNGTDGVDGQGRC